MTSTLEPFTIEVRSDVRFALSPDLGETRRGMDRSLIAKKLVELRGGKSREEVAKALNITVRALESYENGSRMPRDGVKAQIAEYYGIRIDLLFFAV